MRIWSNGFVDNNGTNGLKSVSIRKQRPNRLSWKCSHAQVMANASFSIWAYVFSVSDVAHKIYATVRSVLSSGCLKTAPSLNNDTSTETIVFSAGLNAHNVSPEINAALTFCKAVSWFAFHLQ